MTSRIASMLSTICAATLLSACDGGVNGGTANSLPALQSTTSTETSALAGSQINSGTRTSTAVTGSLNRSTNTAQIGAASGQIDAARAFVALATGGSITLEPGGNTYSARYTASPTKGAQTRGIIGIATPVSDMPRAGTVTRVGTSQVTIQDGFNVYDVSGTSTVTADLSAGTVSTTLDGLSGTVVADAGARSVISNVGRVDIVGSTLTDSRYTGGTAMLTSAALSQLSNSANTQMNGHFFGPRASEVGGTVVISDGTFLLMGDFLGH